MPVPHITMRSGTSAFRPQGCLWWEVAQATCRYSLQMLESCLPGQPTPKVEWELVSNCSSLPMLWWDSSEVNSAVSESPQGE